MSLLTRNARVVLLCLLASCGSPDPAGPGLEPLGIPIDIPSAAETIFAERRDFTVVGYFEPPLTHPGDVRVELFAGEAAAGAPLRVVRSYVDVATGITPREALDFSYAAGNAWGPEGPVRDPREMVMTPDLVSSPGGLTDPTNKVVVTHEYYAAVILGGVTKDFDTIYEDANGAPWLDLTAGVYTLRVTGESGDLLGQSATRRLEFGETDAMLGRFAPPDHKERLLAEAAAAGLRTYIDFFPGFFSHAGYSYEIMQRWMPNNSIEVVNASPPALFDGVNSARNDVLLYNISGSSATNRIEIGSLAAHDLVDSDRTTFHYYSVGEPTLRYAHRTTQAVVSRESSIESFVPSDRLVLTRLEVEAEGREPSEGIYDVAADRPLLLVTEFSAPVLLAAGEMFSLFGVVSPIPTTTTNGDLPVQHVLDNTIAIIRYGFEDASNPGPVVHQEIRVVGLRRRYDPAGAPDVYAHSVYEFEHEFQPSMAGLQAGSYRLSLQCLDSRGDLVTGGGESLEIVITGDAPSLP